MPGYEVTPVEPLKPGFLCGECTLLLRDPVQTEDGDRLCLSCTEAIRSTGPSTWGGKKLGECYPDRAVNREILNLMVKCNFFENGCTWQGKLKDLELHIKNGCEFQSQPCSNDGCEVVVPRQLLENHLKSKCLFRIVLCQHCGLKVAFRLLETHYLSCEEYPVVCENCSSAVKKSTLEYHKENYCPYVLCCCGEKIRRDSLLAHLSDSKKLPTHMNALFSLYQNLQRSQANLQSNITSLGTREVPQSGDLERVENEVKVKQYEVDSRLKALEEKSSAYEQIKEELESVRSQNVLLREGHKVMEDKVQSQGRELERVKIDKSMMRPGSGAQRYTESYSDSRMMMVEKKVEDLERQNAMLKVHVSELELQLQASLASTHNGAFLWRIPEVTRRRRDAVDERITSIYSPPFYTGRNGYKMCIRAYLNGDGIGYKTHLSLFFVLMRGEYDPLLKWPFDYKVSLILVDQDHRKHIVQTFKPTPESSSFKRPTSDMNVASGCPQFSKLGVLDDNSYVKEDIMYVKCIVDVSRIFHP